MYEAHEKNGEMYVFKNDVNTKNLICFHDFVFYFYCYRHSSLNSQSKHTLAEKFSQNVGQ